MLLFWPDSTQKKARHSLDQLLYAIRTSVDDELFSGVNPIRLNPRVISSDAADFVMALHAGDLATAVDIYGGPLLDGFYPSDTREFEEWLSRERERLAHRYGEALEKLCQQAERDGDLEVAVLWRKRLTESDPLSTRHAAALIRALEASGDRAGALLTGEHYLRMAENEIGAENVSVVSDLLRELRATAPLTAPNVGIATTSSGKQQRQAHEMKSPRFGALAFVAGMALLLIGVMALRSGDGKASTTEDRERAITSNVAAYDLYRRAIDPVLLRNDSTALIGLDYLKQAVKLDPQFAAAYAEMGGMYQRLAMSNRSSLPLAELKRAAIDAVNKAIALDDSLAEAHSTLGLIESFWALDLSHAEAEFRTALRLDPTLPHTREYLATVLIQLERPQEALAEARLAERVDPLSPTAKATTAQVLYVLDRCREAMPSLDSLAAITPPLLRVPVVRSLCFGQLNKWQDAVNAIRVQAERGEFRSMGILGLALAKTRSRPAADTIRARLRDAARINGAANFYVAMVALALGDSVDAESSMRAGMRATGIPYELYGSEFTRIRESSRAYSSSRRGETLASIH